MISLTCTQCHAQLEMDDAFAGGVCRCQYCGTIQTVPSKMPPRRAARPGEGQAGGAAGGFGPTPVAPPHPAGVGLMEQPGGRPQPLSAHAAGPHGAGPQVAGPDDAAPEDDGLGALANALKGNGSAGTGYAPPPPAGSRPVDYAHPPRQQSNRNVVLFLAAGGALLVALLLAAFMFFGTTTQVVTVPGPGTGPGTTGGNGSQPQTGGEGDFDGGDVVIPEGPHFLGINLRGEPRVVYLIDRGGATSPMFDTLKYSMYKSMESLEAGQKFGVVFWDLPGEEHADFPATDLADRTTANIEAARAQFAEVLAMNRANAPDALWRAVALRPSVIVLVTGKAFDVEEELVAIAKEAVADNPGLQIHTVSLHDDEDHTVLKRVAKETKGEFKVVPFPDLRQYAR